MMSSIPETTAVPTSPTSSLLPTGIAEMTSRMMRSFQASASPPPIGFRFPGCGSLIWTGTAFFLFMLVFQYEPQPTARNKPLAATAHTRSKPASQDPGPPVWSARGLPMLLRPAPSLRAAVGYLLPVRHPCQQRSCLPWQTASFSDLTGLFLCLLTLSPHQRTNYTLRYRSTPYRSYARAW